MLEAPHRKPWQKKPLVLLLAAIVGAGPMYLTAILSGYAAFSSGEFAPPGVRESLINVAITVVFFGLIMLAMLYLVCGEGLPQLQLKKSTLLLDIVNGLGLAGVILLVLFVYGAIVQYSQSQAVPESNIEIAQTLAGDPLLMAVWLGPVVWLQAAVMEEFTRVFVLSRLWQAWPGIGARLISLFAFSLLFGLGHIYQGSTGVAGTMIIGLVLGLHYMRNGRVLPLIIAHGVYDTLVILALVAIQKSGMF